MATIQEANVEIARLLGQLRSVRGDDVSPITEVLNEELNQAILTLPTQVNAVRIHAAVNHPIEDVEYVEGSRTRFGGRFVLREFLGALGYTPGSELTIIKSLPYTPKESRKVLTSFTDSYPLNRSVYFAKPRPLGNAPHPGYLSINVGPSDFAERHEIALCLDEVLDVEFCMAEGYTPTMEDSAAGQILVQDKPWVLHYLNFFSFHGNSMNGTDYVAPPQWDGSSIPTPEHLLLPSYATGLEPKLEGDSFSGHSALVTTKGISIYSFDKFLMSSWLLDKLGRDLVNLDVQAKIVGNAISQHHVQPSPVVKVYSGNDVVTYLSGIANTRPSQSHTDI